MAASGPFDFAKHRRPQFERPLSRARAAESDDGQMPVENLSDLLGRVSENSTGEIDSLIGDFERLRRKLQTDGERLQREIEEYKGTEPTRDRIYESHLQTRGESSSIGGPAHLGNSGNRVKGFGPLHFMIADC